MSIFDNGWQGVHRESEDPGLGTSSRTEFHHSSHLQRGRETKWKSLYLRSECLFQFVFFLQVCIVSYVSIFGILGSLIRVVLFPENRHILQLNNPWVCIKILQYITQHRWLHCFSFRYRSENDDVIQNGAESLLICIRNCSLALWCIVTVITMATIWQ